MKLRRLNIVSRGLAWRKYVQESLAAQHLLANELEAALRACEQTIRTLGGQTRDLEARADATAEAVKLFWITTLKEQVPERFYFGEDTRVSFGRRGEEARLLAFEVGNDQQKLFVTNLSAEIVEGISSGQIKKLSASRIESSGTRSEWRDLPQLLEQVVQNPQFLGVVFGAFENTSDKQKEGLSGEDFFRCAKKSIASDPDLADFIAQSRPTGCVEAPPPFYDRDLLPPYRIPASPRKRSAVFLHNNYYQFQNLAKALTKHGWDALTVSLAPRDGPQQKFYHGEDLNLYDADPQQMRAKAGAFFKTVPERFGVVHFYGEGAPSFFVENSEFGDPNTKIPWDFLELKRHRLTIGYTPSGCMGGALQSSIHKISGGICDRCVWQLRPDVCSDAANAAWIEKLELLCDWVGLEGDWVTPEREGSRFVRDPIVLALDPDKWRPDLEVPPQFKIEKKSGEFLVYHAVGNYESRRQGDRDIKGTGAIQAAIARLQEEGVPVRLFFATNIPSRDVRFFQVQADIVIDQLNYGRLGANSRESLMLGRPLITSVRAGQNVASPYLLEIPAVNASEESIYQELKMLLSDPQRRERLKYRARAFALKWHASDVCASRFEQVIDRVSNGLPADIDLTAA